MARKTKAAKRGNGEGSIYQKPNGTWMAQITVGTNEEGKPVRKAFTGQTRGDVAAKMAPYLGKASHQRLLIQQELSLDKHMLFWLMNFKRRTVTGRTFETYMKNFHLYICPNLGKYKAQDITKNQVQIFLGRMLDDGFCLDTVKKSKNLLSQYFEYCLDENIVGKNPVSKIKLQTKERKTFSGNDTQNIEEKEYKAIPEELRDKVYAAISTDPLFKALCLTSMLAGLRIGEVLGLKWKDFDPDKKSLSVLRALTIEPVFDEEGRTVKRNSVIGETKTAGSERILPIGELLTDVLLDWHKLRAVQEFLTKKPLSKPNDYVFGNNDGNLRTYYGTRTMFCRLLKRNGLDDKNVHFYSFRHTFSNTLFEEGKNPKVIQSLMGHKKVETTMRYNTATTTTYLRDAADVFDGRYGNNEKDNAKAIPVQKENDLSAVENKAKVKENLAKQGTAILSNIETFMNEHNFESLEEAMTFLDAAPLKTKKQPIEM